MIWYKNLFDKKKVATFSPIRISPDTDNEYLFFEFIQRELPNLLENWLNYYKTNGFKFKPHYLAAIEQQIKEGDFTNPHTFPDYFNGEFDFISIAFNVSNIPKEIACSMALAYVKNGKPVYWTSYLIIPPGEEEGIFISDLDSNGYCVIEPFRNFKKIWDTTLSELSTNNLLVFYDSVVDLSILKTLFRSYNIKNYKFWYTDILSILDLSGSSKRLAQLEGLGLNVIKEEDVEEDAMTIANIFHELTKVYPNYENQAHLLSFGK